MDKEREDKGHQPKITKFPISKVEIEENSGQGSATEKEEPYFEKEDSLSEEQNDKIIPLKRVMEEKNTKDGEKGTDPVKEEEQKKEIRKTSKKRGSVLDLLKAGGIKKILLIALLTIVLSLFVFKTVNDFSPKTISQDEVGKYTVEHFVSSVYGSSKLEENPFPKGRRIQLFGPISRIKDGCVYMKSEDKMVEIALSSATKKNTDLSKFILGKNYKLEATVVDATASDDTISLNEADFVIEHSQKAAEDEESKE